MQIPGIDVYYAVTRSAFVRHLEMMLSGGYRLKSVNDLLKEQQSSEANAIALTFDDGHISNHDIVFPLLSERGISADFFVNPENIGRAGYITWDSLREMSEAGMSIQSHGYSHRYFDELTEPEIRDELDRSKMILEDKLGRLVSLFAPPGGRLTRRVCLIARELGYQAICGSRPGRWVLTDTAYEIPRLAVLWTTSEERIDRWIRGDRVDVSMQIMRYQITYIAKKFFGNRLYEDIRAILLKAMGGE